MPSSGSSRMTLFNVVAALFLGKGGILKSGFIRGFDAVDRARSSSVAAAVASFLTGELMTVAGMCRGGY